MTESLFIYYVLKKSLKKLNLTNIGTIPQITVFNLDLTTTLVLKYSSIPVTSFETEWERKKKRSWFEPIKVVDFTIKTTWLLLSDYCSPTDNISINNNCCNGMDSWGLYFYSRIMQDIHDLGFEGTWTE